MATVHRELSFIRRIHNAALSHGGNSETPSRARRALDKAREEKQRERILTPAEETGLLDAVSYKACHLGAINIFALV